MKHFLSSVSEWRGDYLGLGSGTIARLDHLFEMFRHNLKVGDQDAARKVVSRLEWIARHLKNRSLQATAWAYVGWSYWEMGNYDAAIAAYQTAESMHDRAGFTEGTLHSMRCIGSVLVEKGELDEGEQLLLHCVKMFSHLNDQVQVALSFAYLIEASVARGDNIGLVDRASNALKLFKENGRPDGARQSLHWVVYGLIRLGRLDEARSAAEEYLTLCRSEGYPLGIERAEILMANWALAAGHETLADQHICTALELAGDEKDAEGLIALSRVLWECGELARSMAVLDEAEDIVTETHDGLWLAWFLLQKGFNLVHARDLDRGEEIINEALPLFEQAGERKGIAYSRNNLADARRFRGDWVTACVLYGEALAIKRELRDVWACTYSLEGLAECAARLGHGATAARMLSGADVLRQRLGSPIEKPLYNQLQGIREVVESANKGGRTPDSSADSVKANELIAWAATTAAVLADTRIGT